MGFLQGAETPLVGEVRFWSLLLDVIYQPVLQGRSYREQILCNPHLGNIVPTLLLFGYHTPESLLSSKIPTTVKRTLHFPGVIEVRLITGSYRDTAILTATPYIWTDPFAILRMLKPTVGIVSWVNCPSVSAFTSVVFPLLLSPSKVISISSFQNSAFSQARIEVKIASIFVGIILVTDFLFN